MRLCSRPSLLLGIVSMLVSGCAQTTRTYPLGLERDAPTVTGSLSVEPIEGGQQVVVVHLHRLPPPERLAPGLRQFVVWLEDERGSHIKVGTLRYDRTHQSGTLLATTDLTAFTVRVTGERDERAVSPSDVRIAERSVTN